MSLEPIRYFYTEKGYIACAKTNRTIPTRSILVLCDYCQVFCKGAEEKKPPKVFRKEDCVKI